MTASARIDRLGYRRALDGIRAFAILSVLIFHPVGVGRTVPILPGGFLGVDAFFVLSGFLITRLLMEEWAVTVPGGPTVSAEAAAV